MPELTDPVQLAGRRAPSRVLFGPHPTNLGRRRAFSDRHVAYYARRAAGGAGIVVTETASVHPSDWPYERAPLAADCAPGWAAVAEACARHGTLVLAGLGHTGGQGSSAYSQAALWAPSRVPDAATRELPAEMEQPEIDAVVAGFAEAAGLAARAGLDGVEVDAGPVSLLRQFLSGLTNQRGDGYGDDKPRLLREVLAAVRDALGPDRVLALRLACDELVPWAGITPEQVDRIGHVGALADSIDLLVVVKGRPYSTAAYRPTAHIPPGFNLELCRAMRDAAAGRVPVALQGSVADPALARSALDDGVADLVELTRAQIADAELVAKVRAGTPERVRPCILCNQACLVADARNPIVSCVTDPRSGHETTDPDPARTDPVPGRVLVVGGGPAGLECARVLAGRGHRVRLAERTGRLGGALRAAAVGPGRGRLALLTDWLEAECRRLGVEIETGREIGPGDLAGAGTGGEAVVLATGSVAAPRRYAPAGAGVPTGDAEGLPGPAPPTADLTTVVDVLDLLERGPDGLPDGPVVIHDPVGAQTGVAAAEWLAGLGREVALVTPDQVAGTQLSRTGDLAGANVRLQRAGIRRELRALLRAVGGGRAVLEDVWTGARRESAAPCWSTAPTGCPRSRSTWPPGRARPGPGLCRPPQRVRGGAGGAAAGRSRSGRGRPSPPGPVPRPIQPTTGGNAMGRVEGKVAFVTGAARGQGRSHALRLAEEGADIIAVDICKQIETVPIPMATPDDLAETVKQVEALDRRIVATEADVRDYGALKAALDEGVAQLGRLDIVCGNAGIASFAPADEMDEATWQDMLDVNLTGVWHTCKAAIPHLKAGGNGGSIILTSSAAGMKAYYNLAHYVSAKHGVIGLMRTLALELAPFMIRVNSIHPTTVNTPMMMNENSFRLFLPDAEHPTADDMAPITQAMNALPIPWVEARDISNAVLFLASDEARYITGVPLPVDAGTLTK